MDDVLKSKLEWPKDAVMIIASRRGEEAKGRMEAVVHVSCRMCRELLAADLKSIRRGMTIPEGQGRPVDFFCIPCAVKHDAGDIVILEDHRSGNVLRAVKTP